MGGGGGGGEEEGGGHVPVFLPSFCLYLSTHKLACDIVVFMCTCMYISLYGYVLRFGGGGLHSVCMFVCIT